MFSFFHYPGVHFLDLDLVKMLHGPFDVGLGGPAVDYEIQFVLFGIHPELVGFLSEPRMKYNIERVALPLYRYRRHDNNLTNNEEKMIDYDQLLKSKHQLD